MDATRFDHWIRTLSTPSTRRRMLSGFLLGAITARFAIEEAAAGPGCKNVGGKCKKAKDCCSGLCKGKKGKKTCKAHDTGGCVAGQIPLECGGAETVKCMTSTLQEGLCFTTTGNAGYCAAAADCVQCKKDADCKSVYGPQAACVSCSSCTQTGGATCAGPSVPDNFQ